MEKLNDDFKKICKLGYWFITIVCKLFKRVKRLLEIRLSIFQELIVKLDNMRRLGHSFGSFKVLEQIKLTLKARAFHVKEFLMTRALARSFGRFALVNIGSHDFPRFRCSSTLPEVKSFHIGVKIEVFLAYRSLLARSYLLFIS